MDIAGMARKLGLSDIKLVVRKAEELRRLSNIQFDSSVMGVGEICKAVICLEIAASRLQLLFDRQSAIKLSGMSEKSYTRSFNVMQNGLGVKNKLDVRELGIQFGCVRLIPFVLKGLSLFKERFLAALPVSRRASADFSRPVFTAVAFYLCAKRHKLKIDKLKLIELCGTSESEFASVATSMKDLCFDTFGITKEKKDPAVIKGHRELLDALPGKRRRKDTGDVSDDSSIDDEDGLEIPSYKRHKHFKKAAYDDWKSSVIASNNKTKADNYRLHSKSEEDVKNLVTKGTVVKGVLLQQMIQAVVAIILFTVTADDSVVTTDMKPSFTILARQFVIAMLVLDTWQYFMHRYMHHNKFLYRHIHSQHHRLVVPYAFGALYNHPIEGLLLDTIGGALSFLLSGMSPRVSIFFFSFATIKTVDDHCGLWLPGNLFHIFFRNNTAYHDVHHQLYGSKFNFSQPFFNIWDIVLGTYMPYSLEKRVGGGFEARPTQDYKAE
ncbi:hypothetical protein GIB67_033111 [Kingdonia uniflora]|uniref:Origin of replication complex subunit 6 n=1 Tax=Kingdonia uniflora TaxID=39325 RepID=A0A7J7MYU9_9MAGN|nr:hypothetical protein GIB67_033111 [Kingdonia uniflora]